MDMIPEPQYHIDKLTAKTQRQRIYQYTNSIIRNQKPQLQSPPASKRKKRRYTKVIKIKTTQQCKCQHK